MPCGRSADSITHEQTSEADQVFARLAGGQLPGQALGQVVLLRRLGAEGFQVDRH
jgi:hypothetical protein